jgi:nucleoside-diphosphate-sugar epimerase
MPEDVDVRIGDIRDVTAVRSAMKGMDAVVHLAALLHVLDPPLSMRKEYERVNVDGTAAIMEAAARAGTKRVVYFSTISVYGGLRGEILSEASPTRPDTFYAMTKLEAEKIILGASAAAGKVNGTVLRCGAIYGARLKGNYQQLVQALAKGRFIPVGDGTNRRTILYVDDAARAALLAVGHPVAAGKIFNVSDGQFHTIREIISAICLALGRKPPAVSVPLGLARCVAGTLDGAAQLIGRKPAFGARLKKYTEDVAVSSERIRMELGFAPEFDLVAGWREAITGMRALGTLPLG